MSTEWGDLRPELVGPQDEAELLALREELEARLTVIEDETRHIDPEYVHGRLEELLREAGIDHPEGGAR